MEAKQRIYNLLEKYVPENAVHYCLDLWVATPFNFRISRIRSTKLGDYRFDPNTTQHTISLNCNLNKYNFLITYIHEYAHLSNTKINGRKTEPHGIAWQNEFKRLMAPMLSPLIFPGPVLEVLKKHMRKPKASSQADPNLARVLKMYDADAENLFFLDDADLGEVFIFRGNKYKKIATRRTRVLCEHVSSGKKYLIPKIAQIENLK